MTKGLETNKISAAAEKTLKKRRGCLGPVPEGGRRRRRDLACQRHVVMYALKIQPQ